jgi:hypothetical protein
MVGIRHDVVLSRYDLILHLEVIPDPDTYRRSQNNPARSEDHDTALHIEASIRQVYSSHRGYYFLSGAIEEKREAALRIIVAYLDR